MEIFVKAVTLYYITKNPFVNSFDYVISLQFLSRTTIAKGQRDYDDIVAGTSDMLNPEYRIRQKGGGRKSVEDISPEIEKAILDMVDKDSYGNPENPLRWTTKSTRHIAEEL